MQARPPRTVTPAKQLSRPWRRAGVSALATLIAYTALLLPPLIRHGWDASLFIVAGSRFTDPARTPAPILVRRHSDGYDGQFYYALATAPGAATARAPAAAGVTFDHPAWRAQRILYPILSRLLALGDPRLLPTALLAANLAALAALAAAASLILPGRAVLLLLLWPGWFTTLTHDTAELTACVFLFAAGTAVLRRRLIPAGLCAAAAALAREDAILLPAGIALHQFAAPWLHAGSRPVTGRAERHNPSLRPTPLATAALLSTLPALLWHGWLLLPGPAAGPGPAAMPTALRLGFPFAGPLARLAQAAGALAHAKGHALLPAAYTLATTAALLALIAAFAVMALRALRQGGPPAPLAAALLLALALMTILPAGGPWTDPTALLRAFAETWCLGLLVAAAALPTVTLPSTTPNIAFSPAAIAVTAIMAGLNVLLCYGQLRGS